jgi:quercetin dioxygenase-like cupin family protein
MTETSFATWSLAPGASAPPLEGQGASLRRVEVPAGHVAQRHSHAHEQFLLVAAGRGTLQCEAGEIGLAPGVVIHLAAGAWHAAEFETPTVLVEVNLAGREAGSFLG